MCVDKVMHRFSSTKRAYGGVSCSSDRRRCLLLRPDTQVFLAMLLSRFRLHLAPSMGTLQQAPDWLVFHVTFAAENGKWVTAVAR